MIGQLEVLSGTLLCNETHVNEISFTDFQVTMLVFVGTNDNARCEVPALPKTDCFMQTRDKQFQCRHSSMKTIALASHDRSSQIGVPATCGNKRQPIPQPARKIIEYSPSQDAPQC